MRVECLKINLPALRPHCLLQKTGTTPPMYRLSGAIYPNLIIFGYVTLLEGRWEATSFEDDYCTRGRSVVRKTRQGAQAWLERQTLARLVQHQLNNPDIH